MNTMITAANIAPYWPEYFIALTICNKPTPTGVIESLVVKINAMKNSFHTDMKLKIVTVMLDSRFEWEKWKDINLFASPNN